MAVSLNVKDEKLFNLVKLGDFTDELSASLLLETLNIEINMLLKCVVGSINSI